MDECLIDCVSTVRRFDSLKVKTVRPLTLTLIMAG